MTVLRKPWLVWVAGVVLLLAVTLPYLYAAAAAGEDYKFGGLLFNPLDGNSYLAKMYQGLQGSWQFRLPYTADPGQGAYLFMYYLLLGHISGWSGIPLIVIYHAARVFAALFMLYSIYCFCKAMLPDSKLAVLAFVLTVLGSGLGWLMLPFGAFTADFWVAEAYPFLSAYANPHFPLALSVLLWLLMPPQSELAGAGKSLAVSLPETWKAAPLTFILAIISPFAVVLALLVLGITFMLGRFVLPEPEGKANRVYASRAVWVAVAGLPVLAYDQWATLRSPQLSAWNVQNVTPSPPLWDLLVSFSPALVLAALGAWRLLKARRGIQASDFLPRLVPLVWVALSAVLLYAPFNLQRRFLVGLYVPLWVLGVWGIDWLAKHNPGRINLIAILLVLVIVPSNLFVLLAARHGIQQRDPLLFLSQEEAEAFDWLRKYAEPDSTVLASPRTGLLIPAHTGLRVIYGHPYETVQADIQKQAVESFYSGDWSQVRMAGFLAEQGVDYVFYGPQEAALGGGAHTPGLSPVFQSGSVSVEAVQPALADAAARTAKPEPGR